MDTPENKTTTSSAADRDILLNKVQSLYNAASLAALPAADHKKLEQIGNDIYAFINDVYTEIGLGEAL